MSAKITAALHQVMQEVSYVQKTGENKFHKYRYAGEADLLEKLRPAMLKAGLLLLPSANIATTDEHGNTYVSVEYTLAHKDGDVWPTTIKAVGCGGDVSKDGRVGDKGVYKALTGANKYLLFKLFQIETGDDPEDDSKVEDPHSTPKPQGYAKEVPEIDDRPAFDESILRQYLDAIDKWGGTSDGLRTWWESEAPFRKEAGIVNGAEDPKQQAAYTQLFNAFKAKGLAIANRGRKDAA